MQTLVLRPFERERMWFLIATMVVMGHHVKVHIEQHSTFEQCQERRQYVHELAQDKGLAIRVTCEVDI